MTDTILSSKKDSCPPIKVHSPSKDAKTVKLRFKSGPPRHDFEFATLFLAYLVQKKSDNFKIMFGRS